MSDSHGAPGPPQPPPGWYDDPEVSGGRRYWDGSSWTEERQAPPQTPAGWYEDPYEDGGRRYWDGERWTEQHEPPQRAPAGWYDDPEGEDQQRYWDGRQWTEHQAPAAVSTSAAPESGFRAGYRRIFPSRGGQIAFWAVMALIALVIVGAIVGGSSSDDQTDAVEAQSATPTTTTTTEPQKPVIQLSVPVPKNQQVVKTDSVAVKGFVTPVKAKVTVNGKPVEVAKGGGFIYTIQLGQDVGHHLIVVHATLGGYQPATVRGRVIRQLSPEELAAQKAQEEADFKAQAETVDYGELIKDPYRFLGDKVVFYSGSILQIQEAYGNGLMILETSCDRFDICDDDVYINYHGHVAEDEDEHVTVYGVVTGSKTYKTQIGGARTIPKIQGKYFEPG